MDANDVCMTRGLKRLMPAPAERGTLALMGRQRLMGIVQRCFKRIQELERKKPVQRV